MKLTIFLICTVLAAAQAFQKVRWIDPDVVALRPSGAKSGPRMINGRPALEGEVPYQTGVLVDHARFCGGTLISSTVVLTSASCIVGMSHWEIYMGSLNLVGPQTSEKVIMSSSVARVHDDFDIMISAHAIGIIKLPSDVQFSDHIQPIRLPSRTHEQVDFAGATVVLSGWGITMKNEAPNNPYLKVANITVINNSDCKKIYGADRLLDSMFCVDTRQQFAGPCFGDLGSPIAFEGADGKKTLLGISIFGSAQECSSQLPAMATRIDNYLDWIATNGGPSVRP